MANFAIYAQAANLSALKVGDNASPTVYTQISKTQRFALAGDADDEVKLEYSAPQTFNAVAITGLNAFPTVTIEKTLSAVDTTLGTVSGSTYAATSRARDTFNALLIFSDQSADDITITFSTPYPTSFRTVFAGYLAFQPTTNFERGARFVRIRERDTLQTRGATYNTRRSKARVFDPQLALMSDEDFFDLDFALDVIDDSNCLVVLDSADTSPEKWMIANVVGENGNLSGNLNNTSEINFMESV